MGDHLVRVPYPWAEDRTEPLSSREELAEIAQQGRNTVDLRKALAFIRVGSDSPAETMLRLAFDENGLPPPLLNTPYAALPGSDAERSNAVSGQGRRHAPDFQWPEFGVSVEYDGSTHNDGKQVERDIQRQRIARAHGFEEVRLHSADTRGGMNRAVRIVVEALRRHGWNEN